MGRVADVFFQERYAGIDLHVITFEQTQVGLSLLLPDALRCHPAGRHSQEVLQVLLIFEPQVKLAAQRRKVARMHRADCPLLPRQANPALRIEAARKSLVFGKVLKRRPQQRFGLIQQGVMANRGKERVVRDQVHMHDVQVIMKNVERVAKATFDLRCQKRGAIRFNAFQFGKTLAGQGMVSTALSHGRVQRLDGIRCCIHQPLGHVPANEFQGFQLTQGGITGIKG